MTIINSQIKKDLQCLEVSLQRKRKCLKLNINKCNNLKLQHKPMFNNKKNNCLEVKLIDMKIIHYFSQSLKILLTIEKIM